MKLSFIGLGKLGLPLASCLAESGNKIIGIDKSSYFIYKLNNNELPFFEPGLSEIFPNSNFVNFTDSYDGIVDDTDATIILVNTQSKDGYSTDLVEKVLEEFSVELKKTTKDYHLIVLSSTVIPGSISKLIDLVESRSGKKYKKDFGFSYVPDFVKLGNVIEDFLNPELFLIGANYDKDIELTKEIWKSFHKNNPPVKILNLQEAEVAKTSLNAYLVHKITFCNFLGEICDKMPGVDVNKVTDAVGLDKRISKYFFKRGTPYGGTCFPRDSEAFIKFSRSMGENPKHILFSEELNEYLYESIFHKIEKYSNIGILGISFKPKSPVTIGSPSVRIIEYLQKNNKKYYLHDCLNETFDNLKKFHSIEATGSTIDHCLNNCDMILIMHPDSRYSKITHQNIYDPWGVLNK